jgi:hypothetical protein
LFNGFASWSAQSAHYFDQRFVRFGLAFDSASFLVEVRSFWEHSASANTLEDCNEYLGIIGPFIGGLILIVS